MNVVFLDLETTGLDPATDRILEIAAARVNERLEPVDGFTAVVRPNPGIGLAMDDYVREMHTKNGLLAELDRGQTLVEVTKPFCEWLQRQRNGDEKLTLAGDSVHFDLSFLRSWIPTAAVHFSHRLLDISAFRVAREFCGAEACPIVSSSGHRAQGDVLASIAKARWHLSRVMP